MVIIGSISQNGGVGKSSLAKLIAVEYARAGWKTLIADMDTSQSTCLRWNEKRKANGILPSVAVKKFNTVSEVLKYAREYDMVIFDGAPHATDMTLKIAKYANLLVIPTSSSIEDLDPQITLAHELVKAGIPQNRIFFVFTRISTNKLENHNALDYLKQTGYKIASETIPDKTSFRKANIVGKTFIETTYKTLTERCESVVQQIVNQIELI